MIFLWHWKTVDTVDHFELDGYGKIGNGTMDRLWFKQIRNPS